ncbi:sodium/potassium/calcium exchanger 6-like [Sarcoptes scabiei]|nr:sodium/potassium/calcium exchanger 6-like [Sarcoptes scabiei]
MINPYVDRNFYSNSSSSSSPSLFQSSQRNRSSSLIRSITSSSTISNWSLESNCGDINFINDRDQQCNFSRTVIECLDDDGFINYIQLTYCTIQSEYYSLALLAFILLILFFSIGTNADDFLCPVLIAISKSLKLSDNIAGVTFLAFGNGAPDIFSSIIGITDANPNLVIGQLYGAGIFVTTVVVGSIMLTREFEIMKRPLMRDIIFYLITTTLVWTTFLERKIIIYHSILFIIIYIVYVFVVIVSGYIYKRNLQNQSSMISVNRMMPRENLNLQKKYKINGPQNSNASLKSLSFVKKFDCDEGVVLTRIKHRQYGLDPIHQRRLTLYHIHSDPHHHHHHHHLRQRKENNHLDSVVENSDNIDQNHLPIYSIADKNFVIDSNNNNNNNTNNNNNYDDEQGEMKSIEFWSKDRRLTISDTNFFSSNNKKSDDIDSADAKISSRQNSILNPTMDHCFNEKDSKKRDVNSVDGSTLINDQTNFFDWIIDSSRFDSKLFNEMNFFHKISMIIKAPIYLVFTLTIPVVDNELPMRGWIRSLNLAHLIVSPQICPINCTNQIDRSNPTTPHCSWHFFDLVCSGLFHKQI